MTGQSSPQRDRLPLHQVADLSEFFKVLGDPTRIRILEELTRHPLCVSELEERLDMSQSAVSHQLRTLKQARLVKARRDGKNVIYVLDDDHVATVFTMAEEHIRELHRGEM